jgi:hypothetical protein
VDLDQLKLSVMFSVTAPGSELYPFEAKVLFPIPR